MPWFVLVVLNFGLVPMVTLGIITHFTQPDMMYCEYVQCIVILTTKAILS